MTRKLKNLIVLMLDAYKLFHRQMYPKNTVLVYSNATPRSGRHRGGRDQGYVIAFGMQRLVRKLNDEFDVFFNTSWETLEPFLKEQLDSFTGGDYDISHLKELHSLGYLPMIIKALPEGTKCPYGVPYMTMYNTEPEFFWLTNYLETWMSAEQWNCITAATTAYQYRQIFDKWASKTTGNTDFVYIQGHDFAMRGHNGSEAATIAGLGHLTCFVGSDTVPAYLDAQYYYNTGINDWGSLEVKGWAQSIVATSVPATEHSVQCAHWNEEAMNDAGYVDELAYLDHILATFPTGIVSIVCDGMDFWGFLTKTLPQRKSEIMAREGKLVVRPDSGDPADIICGIEKIYNNISDLHYLIGKSYKSIEKEYYYIQQKDGYYLVGTTDDKNGIIDDIFLDGDDSGYTYLPLNSPKIKGAIELLWDIFGGTINEKGYKELDSHIGLIYGDSITLDRAEDICSRLETKGFASTNWVAGIGSYTYQMVTRDTDGQAFKATYVELQHDESTGYPLSEGEPFIQGKPIFKSPKTGDGTKKSAKGLITVMDTENMPKLVDEVTWAEQNQGLLRVIFKNGKLLNQETLFQIRKRIQDEL